jgi:di/tricarboxylate transporter
MLGMILTASFESRTHIGTLHAALIAAGLMGVAGCVSAGQARRSIDVPVLVAIAAALVIGKSIESTGLAAAWAQQLIASSSAFGPSAVLASVYLLTMLMTELIPNNAAAALAFPIAHAAAHGLGVNLMPFAVAVAIAASAGFAIPFGYQTHLMVLGPGGYRFGDFVRMGLALDVLCGIVTVTLAPIVYPF